ncbi:hypothetical protein GCM10010330_03170 [Streptomyces tendae]|nr:hypothetical protein GCM10010330_03170 [Streptomyces tendae]
MARWSDETYGWRRTSWDLAPGSDRTAGDSSPVTQENGRLRGRPGPAVGTCPSFDTGLSTSLSQLATPASRSPSLSCLPRSSRVTQAT